MRQLVLMLIFCLGLSAQAVNSYTQTNLVSDIPGMAVTTEPLLVNPWGLSRPVLSTAGEAHWWAADERSGVSTLYNANGSFVPLTITIPPGSGTGAGTPTGTVFFNKNFVFATLDGTISQWFAGTTPSKPGTGCAKCHTTTAVIKVNNFNAGAVYSGITVANNGGVEAYYAANSAGGVEAYSASSYAPVTLAGGAFTDSSIPVSAKPFGIQSIGAKIYVTFYDPVAGGGYVDAFDTSGALLLRLQHGSWFSEPWGIAHAPSTFGAFSNALLVGNAATGNIAAFNPATGKFVGFLKDSTGAKITIPGLWAIAFGANNTDSGPSNTLYFAAGIDNYAHGLFGSITAN